MTPEELHTEAALVLSFPKPTRAALALVPGPGWAVRRPRPTGHTVISEAPSFAKGWKDDKGESGWLPASEGEIVRAAATRTKAKCGPDLIRLNPGETPAKWIARLGEFVTFEQGDGATPRAAALDLFARVVAAEVAHAEAVR